eukprot:COSAG02_NODE_5932_length_3934_cov_4285.433116_1_plen_86_part_00
MRRAYIGHSSDAPAPADVRSSSQSSWMLRVDVMETLLRTTGSLTERELCDVVEALGFIPGKSASAAVVGFGFHVEEAIREMESCV